MNNYDKGKILIKYYGDRRFGVKIKGNIPVEAVLLQTFLGYCTNLSKDDFLDMLGNCYDDFMSDKEEK